MSTTFDQISSLESDRQELEREIEDWRNWWHELCELGMPHFGEMGVRLSIVREKLGALFQQEEFRGPLAGRRGADVERLWAEHANLLEELDRLIARLSRPSADFTCWGEARSEFETFLDRLHAHDVRKARMASRRTAT